jgi:HD-GYP domain-containing protein (c-di-GMP phosphodiesterase class II)
MRTHPALGHRLLRSMDFMHDAALIVLQHQERWDGRGYPQGLRGDEIVLGARVFAVVDAFDAMSSDRPYRRGCPLDQAIAEIARCSGTQFDPAVVRAFMAVPPIAWLDVREQVEQRDSARRAAEADAAPTAPPT